MGMSERIGPVSVPPQDGEARMAGASDAMLETVDDEVRRSTRPSTSQRSTLLRVLLYPAGRIPCLLPGLSRELQCRHLPRGSRAGRTAQHGAARGPLRIRLAKLQAPRIGRHRRRRRACGQTWSPAEGGGETMEMLRARPTSPPPAESLAGRLAATPTPTPALDHPMRRLSQAANRSRLWLAVAGMMAAVGGRPGRRAAGAGMAGITVDSVPRAGVAAPRVWSEDADSPASSR